jgi:hypothetical protein
VTECDLTCKPRYFGKKLKRGGHSHKMRKNCSSCRRGANVVVRVYIMNVVSMNYERLRPDASRSNFQPGGSV